MNRKLYIRPLAEVVESYSFLMGYTTGKQKKWYCGIEGITFIFNGAWNDPEVGYKGLAINETYLDGLWSQYGEECQENGMKATYDGYAVWMRENKDLVYEELDNLVELYHSYNNVGNVCAA